MILKRHIITQTFIYFELVAQKIIDKNEYISQGGGQKYVIQTITLHIKRNFVLRLRKAVHRANKLFIS